MSHNELRRGDLRSVFFDVDFTLIYPGPALLGEGYQRACAARGVVVDATRFDAAVKASSSILDEVEEPVYDHQLFIDFTASIIRHMGGDGDQVAAAASDIYQQWSVNHHFEMYDDVEPVLRGLVSRGLTVGVISNSHRSLDAFREHFSLTGVIHSGVSSFEHGFLKPHASIFEEALARAGADASTSAMVGDSLHADIGGALAAGMRPILLRRSGETPTGVPEGVPIIRTLHELERYL